VAVECKEQTDQTLHTQWVVRQLSEQVHYEAKKITAVSGMKKQDRRKFEREKLTPPDSR
jgi:hypothetical protein